MKELIIRHGIITIVLMTTGIGLYFTMNYLLDLPGRIKIDRIYETDDEKFEDSLLKKKIFKTYIVILIWIVIAANLLIYYSW